MKKQNHHSLDEAAARCGFEVKILVRFIAFEWIVPFDLDNQLLDEQDIARARLIWQLQNELGVNDESVSIILHLIDQLNRTHFEVKALHDRVGHGLKKS